MRSKRWLVFATLVALIVVATIIIARGKKDQHSIFSTANPSYGTIQTTISTTGTVQPQNRLELRPPINGRIEQVLVREGDKVRRGQTLAYMSSTERAALLDAARAKDAKQLAYWEEVYRPTPLIAPINGEVIVRAAEPGQGVTSSDPVIVLSDRLIVQAQVDETDIGRIKIGQKAIITLDAYPDTKVLGRVDHIAYESTIVNNVTIYKVDIIPERVPKIFRSGMSANIEIVEQNKEDVLLVPIEAVQRDEEGSYLLVADPKGGYVKRRVELGISDEKNVEVVSGVGPMDKIAIPQQVRQAEKKRPEGVNPFLPVPRRRN